ncbi:MAG: demethoxyubiquinone hydroxylase family protein [Pyrinomonadaceae bacterium]|nr:demethoxyubiquinone hydroxylase family protein [Pyrinomonadaceae bacterium]
MLENARQNLIRILQNAHAGELAAGFAYRGHWKSLRESDEKKQIKIIETEEWLHRDNVRKWLTELGAEPRRLREAVFWTIGQSLGVLCFVSGWFLPMYFAGRLESQNILEYEEAAKYANELNMKACEREMLEMSRVEAQHEEFFSRMVAAHRLLPVTKKFFGWS